MTSAQADAAALVRATIVDPVNGIAGTRVIKLASSLGAALRRREGPDTAAELAAETGIAVLRIALAY
ncbi:MAG: hypothetical protein ABJA87_13625 [bacterium]